MSEIKVKVFSFGGKGSEVHTLSSSARIDDLLENLDRNPETVIVKLNGRIVPEEEELVDGDQLEIIPVVSGG